MSRKRRSLPFLAALVALGSISSTCVWAQSAPGFSAGLGIGYDRVYLPDGLEIDGGTTGKRTQKSGGAVSIAAAWSPHTLGSLFVAADGASVSRGVFSTVTAAQLDLGARIHVPVGPASVAPFAIVAVSTRALVTSDNRSISPASRKFEFTGRGLTWGAGLHNYFQRTMALTVQLTATHGSYNSLRTTISSDEGPDDESSSRVDRPATSIRLGVGLTYFFSR